MKEKRIIEGLLRCFFVIFRFPREVNRLQALSKQGAAVSCNYSGFPKETLELQFRRRFFSFFVRSQIAVKSSSRIRSLLIFNACATFWVMSKWHCVMADDEKLSRCKISIDTVYNTLKTHTKYVHIVRGRPALKDVERFRNGSVREPYERSLYERTFMSEPFIEKHAISTELSNVNREKHRRKSHRVCRRDREPSRIPIRNLKRLRNKSRKVRKFVYARILSCIPMSSTLYCYVNVKKTIE